MLSFPKMSHNNEVKDILELLAAIKKDCLNYNNAKITLEQQLTIIKSELNKRNEDIRNHQKEIEDMQKLVAEQQFTISRLVEIKNEYYNQKTIFKEKEKTIEELLKEIDILNMKHGEEIEKIKHEYDIKLEQSKNEISAVICNNVSNSKGLQDEIQKILAEKDDQLTVIIMEYEEKLQRSEAEMSLLRDELKNTRDHSNTTISVYHEKLKEMECKLKNQQQNLQSVAPIIFKTVTPKEKPRNSFKLKSNSENKNFSPLKVTVAPMNVSEKSEFQEIKKPKRKLFSKFKEDFVNGFDFDNGEDDN